MKYKKGNEQKNDTSRYADVYIKVHVRHIKYSEFDARRILKFHAKG